MIIGCVSAFPRALAHAHYSLCYLLVMVKISIQGINVSVVINGSLVWWDSLQDSVVQCDFP